MNKIIVSAVVLATFLSISCKKKSEEKPAEETAITPAAPVSSAESKNIMSGSKDAMKNDVVSLTKGQGVTELTNMADVIVALDPTEPISLSRIASGEGIEPNEMAGLLSKQAKVFKKLFFPASVINSLNRTESAGSDFDKNLGEYAWDEATKTWTKSANAEKIIIRFPSDSTKRTVNDAVFTLTNFAETVTDEDTLPTSIIADLKVKSKTVASINYTGAYSKDGTPTAMNGSVFLDPFTYTVSFTDNGSSVSGSTTLLKGTEVVAGISTTINLTGTGSNRNATSLSGYVKYRDIKMAGSVSNLNSTDDDSTLAQINSHFDLDILRSSDNAKIADLSLADREDTKGNTESYIKMTYTDGTTDDIVNYLKPAADELEKFVQDQAN